MKNFIDDIFKSLLSFNLSEHSDGIGLINNDKERILTFRALNSLSEQFPIWLNNKKRQIIDFIKTGGTLKEMSYRCLFAITCNNLFAIKLSGKKINVLQTESDLINLEILDSDFIYQNEQECDLTRLILLLPYSNLQNYLSQEIYYCLAFFQGALNGELNVLQREIGDGRVVPGKVPSCPFEAKMNGPFMFLKLQQVYKHLAEEYKIIACSEKELINFFLGLLLEGEIRISKDWEVCVAVLFREISKNESLVIRLKAGKFWDYIYFFFRKGDNQPLSNSWKNNAIKSQSDPFKVDVCVTQTLAILRTS